VEVADYPTFAEVRHYLTVGGRKVRVHLPPGQEPFALSGSQGRAVGRFRNTDNFDATELLVTSSDTAALSGTQDIAVLLVNFQNDQSIPYSPEHARAITFDSTQQYYQEVSYGKLAFSGTVFGWWTLPITETSCSNSTIRTEALAEAQRRSVSLNGYERIIIGFPRIAACGWWGLGTVGSTSSSTAWINGDYQLKVVGHELGHNFGAYHSKSQSCDAGACTISEYGDTHDIMGVPSVGHFNVLQKERAGWLTVPTITQSGQYWIDALAPVTLGTKGFKINTPASDVNWTYVEVRNQFGFDAGLEPGVLVHRGDSTSGVSLLADLFPLTSEWRGVVRAGETYTDPATGSTLFVENVGSAGATVFVTLNVPPVVLGVAINSISVTSKNYSITARTTNGTQALSSVPVSFRIVSPNGSITTRTLTTNSTGYAAYTYVWKKGRTADPYGTYLVTVTATYENQTVSASSSFVR
jgi:hypothetical protein